MKKRVNHGNGIGSASILLIFTVLSLVSFATLTLMNSRADYKLTTNLAERQTDYYRACHEGYAFVAAVNSGYTLQGDDGIMKESIPITDNQSLDITIIQNSSDNSEIFAITQWQIVVKADSDYDYTLPVFK